MGRSSAHRGGHLCPHAIYAVPAARSRWPSTEPTRIRCRLPLLAASACRARAQHKLQPTKPLQSSDWPAAMASIGCPVQKLLDDPRIFADGGGGAAAAHLGDDGVQPERASAMTMMRGGCEHVKGRVASNPLTMNTRENQKRASSAKRRGRRGALPAVPMGAGGRPPSVGKPVTSSFSWAGSGVLDG